MVPFIQIAMMLMAKKQQQAEQKRQQQEQLANDRAEASGGDTQVAKVRQQNRALGDTNFIGNAGTLYGAFKGGDGGGEEDQQGADDYDWKKGSAFRNPYGV